MEEAGEANVVELESFAISQKILNTRWDELRYQLKALIQGKKPIQQELDLRLQEEQARESRDQ